MATYNAVNACPIRKEDKYWGDHWTYGSWAWRPDITPNLRQGTYSYFAISDDTQRYIDYYGVMVFDNAAIQAQYATHFPTAARLRLTRTASGAHSHARTMGLYAGNQTGIPAVGNNNSTPATVPSPVTSRYDYSISGGQNEKVINIALALAESICTGASNCLYMFVGRSTSGYMSFVGRDDLTKVVLEIDWQARQPAPTAPTNPTVTSPITGASPTLSWGASSDHMFSSDQIAYEVELSFNGGASWVNLHTTAAGVTSYTPNLKTILELQAAQYYLNSQFRFHVRAKTPVYSGQNYYSAWAQTANRTIDYRIVPSAPGITPSKTNPYEGEAITFAMTRPSQYNTHSANGDVMILGYGAYLDGASVAQQTRDVGTASFNLPYTVGNLTTGMTDRTMALTARCWDTEGQLGAFTAQQNMTIRRFRAPVVAVTNIVRAAASAIVGVGMLDTGFATPQGNGQIRKIQYNIGEGWVDASLGSWDGLHNTFTVPDLDPDTRYELQVRAVNVEPVGELGDKTGAPYSITVLEFSPAFFSFKNIETGVTGAASKSLIVAKDPTQYEDDIEEDDIIVAGLARFAGSVQFDDASQAQESLDVIRSTVTVATGDGADPDFWRSLTPGQTYRNDNNSIANMPFAWGFATVEWHEGGDVAVLYQTHQSGTGPIWRTTAASNTVTCEWRKMWDSTNLTFSYSSGTLTITTS